MVSLSKVQLDLEVPKQWLNSFRLTWMVEEVRKTQFVAGGGVTGKTTAVPQSAGTEDNLPSAEERDRRKSRGADETVAVGSRQSSEMEGDFLL